MMPATPRSSSSPHAAATAPNSRYWTRPGRPLVCAESRGYLVGRQPALEGRELVVLHCLAVLGELELTDHDPGLLELVQMHVQQRPGHLEPPGQLADVNTAPPELGDDPQPMGVRHRRQRRKEFIAGQFQLHLMSA